MSKNKSRPSNSAPSTGSGKTTSRPTEAPKRSVSIENWNKLPVRIQLLVVGGIALLTWLFFMTCLGNQFTNWDDPGYVKDNALVKDISPEGITNIFSTPIMGNYHPLTILSYAIEYSYVRLQPSLYHLDSVLFHILVTILVFYFINMLTGRAVAAAVTALLFGLHPMHVESVAWIAARKDVVYSVFYVLACITYLLYARGTNKKKWLWYVVTLLLFLCSLLSKPVVVVLPVILLLIDLYNERKRDMAMLLDKIPYFALSIAFGLKSVHDQKVFGSIGSQSLTHNFIEHICLGAYALVTYLWKAVLPVQLCNFYPYPDKLEGGLPFVLYLYPLGLVGFIVLTWLVVKKNKVLMFGLLFFLINILLLLQFLPVGGAILADRYAYMPYLGLFFIAGWYVSGLYEPSGNKQLRLPVTAATMAYALLLGYLSNERCKVWYDTATLWTDEIQKEPVRAPNAYNNLGFHYFNKFNDEMSPALKKVYFDSSAALLQKAIELQPGFANPYITSGELLRSVGRYADAKIKYYTAIHLQPVGTETANAFLGLGIIYAINRVFDSSEICFRKALEMKPYFPEAHSNFGNFYDMTGRHEEAIKEYGVAITQNPDMTAPYLNRGRTFQRMRRCDEAMKDFETALSLSPGMGEIYYARSYCLTFKGRKPEALRDVEKALSLGYTNIDRNYYQMLKSGN